MLYQINANEKKEKGNLKRAIAAYTKSIKKSPLNANLYSMRGITYAERKNHQRAFEDFAKGLELDPYNEPLKVLLKQAALALRTPAAPKSSSDWVLYQTKADEMKA